MVLMRSGGSCFGVICCLWGVESVLASQVYVLCLWFGCLDRVCVCGFSMGFLVACLMDGCMECCGDSDLCVRVDVLCGHGFMAQVLFLCCVICDSVLGVVCVQCGMELCCALCEGEGICVLVVLCCDTSMFGGCGVV